MISPVIKQLILIRHARTDYNRSCVPPENPPLDIKTNHDYAAMGADLPDRYRWMISPLIRCQQTADQLVNHGAIYSGKYDDDRLREQSYGKWHGQNIETLWHEELSQGEKHNWHFIHPDRIPPDGESFSQVMTKLKPTLPEYATENTVLITHGMVIRALIGLAMGLSADQALALDIAPLSMTGLTYMKEGASPNAGSGGYWQLNYLNRAY
jgi:broad specificity phosphatase PhoE